MQPSIAFKLGSVSLKTDAFFSSWEERIIILNTTLKFIYLRKTKEDYKHEIVLPLSNYNVSTPSSNPKHKKGKWELQLQRHSLPGVLDSQLSQQQEPKKQSITLGFADEKQAFEWYQAMTNALSKCKKNLESMQLEDKRKSEEFDESQINEVANN